MALKKKYKVLVSFIVILALAVLFYTFFVQVRKVGAGEIGVKASLGSPVDNSADHDIEVVRGYVVFMPLYSDLMTYSTAIQIVSYDNMVVTAKDGVAFDVKPSISYQLNETKAAIFYKAIRASFSSVNDGYLKEIVTDAYNEAASTFPSDSLAENERQFEVTADALLSVKMSEIGLVLKNTVANLDCPSDIKKAIEIRSKSLQEALIVENRLREAEALRKEDSIRYSALTPLAIQKMFIDKWDGRMPAYGGTVTHIYDSISSPK